MYDRAGDTGQLRDVDAVAAVGPAGDDLAQEDDFAALLGDGYIHAAHAGQQVRDLHQFVIVRGEERARTAAFVVVQVFDDGAGDGEAVVGAGAASDLVEDQQTARRGVV